MGGSGDEGRQAYPKILKDILSELGVRREDITHHADTVVSDSRVDGCTCSACSRGEGVIYNQLNVVSGDEALYLR